MPARRHEAREHRRPLADRRQLVERERHLGLARHREQVQDPVRRAAGRGDPGRGVEERAPVEERARGDVPRGEVDGGRPGPLRRRALRLDLLRRHEPVAEPRDPEAVERHRHRVRGEVARARAGPRTRDGLELVQLPAREQPPLLCADGLPDVLDRHLAAVQPPGAHRPAVEDAGRLVDARERHQRGRDGLVAPDEADERVEVVRVRHQLDRVGDHLTGDQRGAHPGRPLRLVVGDGDRVERQRHAPGCGDARAHRVGEVAVVEVARHRPGPGRDDADDRAVEPLRVDADRAEVRPRARPLGAGAERRPGPPAEVGVLHRGRVYVRLTPTGFTWRLPGFRAETPESPAWDAGPGSPWARSSPCSR